VRERAPRTRLRRAAVGLLLGLGTLALLEGAASLIVFAWDLARHAERPLPERIHTVYDPLLGWVNAKGLRAPDLYGPGRSFASNALGFRGAREYARAVPEGKRRAICSGDSFTLGYGVGDEHCWPRLLELRDPALEAVNMGQGGYALDQAYLWYLRDGRELEHQLHLFAFIADDFERMRAPRFRGYGKPLLVLAEDVERRTEGDPAGEGLATIGVPVPASSFRHPWLTQNRDLVLRLRSLELLGRARRKLAGAEPVSGVLAEETAQEVASRLFLDLARLNEEKGSRLVLVLLPNKDPLAPGRLSRLSGWMHAAVERARGQGVPFIDLSADFEALPAAEREPLFLPPGLIPLPGAAGHYSETGNAFVADRLRALLAQQGLLAGR
jgi:hypothetical protein